MVFRLDLLTLKLFMAIVEEQSIAKAAEREHIAASAVSRRISDLEEALGTPLLHRHYRGIDPTPAGRALLQHAHTIMRDLAQLESELVGYSKGMRGHVRIFANDSTIFSYLPEELSGFLAEHPMVRIEFNAEVSPAIVQAVSENAADIGIFAGDIQTGDLQVFPYHKDRLVVVVPRGHPLGECEKVKFFDLIDYELIDQEKRSSIETLLLRASHALGRSPKTRIRVGSFDATCRMIQANLGIGIMPERFAATMASVMNISAVALDEPWAIRQHWLCVRDMSSLPVAARLLVKHLVPADIPTVKPAAIATGDG
ncbi:MAG TPA: LysR family transcriptional regulator [Alphaproteobacteria bacterium]|nr:LysR family transcriptional regulator [Alphaproteobacteria bacterium]